MHVGMITCTSLGVIKTSVSFDICIHPPVQAKAQCIHIFRPGNNFILQLRLVDHLKQQVRKRNSRAVEEYVGPLFLVMVRFHNSAQSVSGECSAPTKIWVQEVPKTKSPKSRETDRMAPARGIARRAVERKPIRQSSGTQYSKPPSVSLTQPSRSGRAQK